MYVILCVYLSIYPLDEVEEGQQPKIKLNIFFASLAYDSVPQIEIRTCLSNLLKKENNLIYDGKDPWYFCQAPHILVYFPVTQ